MERSTTPRVMLAGIARAPDARGRFVVELPDGELAYVTPHDHAEVTSHRLDPVPTVVDGDAVAVLAMAEGAFVAGTGGPREAPRRALVAEAIATERDVERALDALGAGERRRRLACAVAITAGIALAAVGAVATVAGGVIDGLAGRLVAMTGVSAAMAGAILWWLGVDAPRSTTGLSFTMVPLLSVPLYVAASGAWPALLVAPVWFTWWTTRDVTVLRAIRAAVRRGDAQVLRSGELHAITHPRPLVARTPADHPVLRPDAVAVVADGGTAAIVVAHGGDVPLDRWLRHRAATLTVLWTAAAAGTALLL